MKKMRPIFLVSLALSIATIGASTQPAQPTRQAVDVAKLGPHVGERVPDFALTDQNGKRWTLQSSMGPKGLMLVFFRSADW